MCCFVLCYFANTKIDESFRTAKIRRTFFGNSLASKFAGCVRKDDFGSGRLRKNRRRKRKTAQFRRAKGYNDPFISRKVLQSHMQFGFGTSAFFPIFGVVTTLLSVGRLCKAICNSFLEQAHFFLSLSCNPQQRVVLAGEKIWKILFETVKRISCFAVQPAPYGTGYDSYVVTARAICAYLFQGFPEPFTK